jgi:hypothetical protein
MRGTAPGEILELLFEAALLDREDLGHEAAIREGEDGEGKGQRKPPRPDRTRVKEETRTLPLHFRSMAVAEDYETLAFHPGGVHIISTMDHAEGEPLKLAVK